MLVEQVGERLEPLPHLASREEEDEDPERDRGEEEEKDRHRIHGRRLRRVARRGQRLACGLRAALGAEWAPIPTRQTSHGEIMRRIAAITFSALVALLLAPAS